MNKRANACILTGLLLIAVALFLCILNILQSSKAGAASNDVVSALQDQLPSELRPDSLRDIYEPKAQEDAPVPPMAVKEENGYNYIGILDIPSLGLSLPVMAEWDYTRLKTAPCVYTGSYYTNDLVICAHNFSTHFGPLSRIELGAVVFLTTVDGYVYTYHVDNEETVQPTEFDRMEDAADWDLTLFTCHPGGATRRTIRCVLSTDGMDS